MKILVAVTGGISAYKAVDVISALKKNGHYVSAMATESALEFVSENVLKITADKYWEHSWAEPIHINATDDVEVFTIVPATANIIAKIVYGLADDLVSSTVIALPKDCLKMIFPCMNSRMIDNVVVQRNIECLKKDGWVVIEPDVGMLACGTVGKGKIHPTKYIVEKILENQELFLKQPLA